MSSDHGKGAAPPDEELEEPQREPSLEMLPIALCFKDRGASARCPASLAR